MTDIIDNANDLAMTLTDAGIDQIREQTKPNDISECIDCEEPIGAARKQAAPFATRCIRCQSEHEESK